jgi:hypothetical protein
VILFQVNPDRIAAVPRERDPPGAIDGDRVAHWIAMQPMKPPAWKSQIVQRFRPVQRLQAPAHALDQIASNAARVILKKEIAQRLAAKVSDHDTDCKRTLDRLQA